MLHVKPSVMNGLWLCVHCQECADRCPKGISSVSDIANLRVMAIKKGLNEGLGRLNEIYLALRSEGVIGSMGKIDIAFKLMHAGKMNPIHVFGEDEIEGHKDLVKMIKVAQEAAVKE